MLIKEAWVSFPVLARFPAASPSSLGKDSGSSSEGEARTTDRLALPASRSPKGEIG